MERIQKLPTPYHRQPAAVASEHTVDGELAYRWSQPDARVKAESFSPMSRIVLSTGRPPTRSRRSSASGLMSVLKSHVSLLYYLNSSVFHTHAAVSKSPGRSLISYQPVIQFLIFSSRCLPGKSAAMPRSTILFHHASYYNRCIFAQRMQSSILLQL